MTNVYQWANTGMAVKADPQQVGEELERIRAAAPDGRLEAADVVEAARLDPNSPLHGLFCWDDTEAAEAYRRDQARRVIRGLRIVTQEADNPPAVRIAYVSPSPQKSPGYIPAHQAMGDPVTRDQVLSNALAALRGWQERYGSLEELADVAAEVDAAAEKLEVKATRKRAKTK